MNSGVLDYDDGNGSEEQFILSKDGSTSLFGYRRQEKGVSKHDSKVLGFCNWKIIFTRTEKTVGVTMEKAVKRDYQEFLF